MAILESELKVRLLDRSSTGVSPTEAGRRLYMRAQVILRQMGSLKLELNEASDAIAGEVAVGLPPSHGASIGNALLARVRAEHPRLRLQIIEDGAAGLASRLRAGLLDIAVSPVALTDPNLEEEVLLHEELFLVCAPSLQPVPRDMAQLAALPWIVTSSPNAIRGLLSAVFTQAGFEPNIVAEINSLPMVIRAVQRGLGVTLLPQAAIAEALVAGTVAISQFMEPAPQRTIHLYRRREQSTTHAERVVHGMIIEIGEALRSSVGVK